jgi:hypothetical protein
MGRATTSFLVPRCFSARDEKVLAMVLKICQSDLDSQPGEKALKKGSSASASVQQQLKDLWYLCRKANIRLSVRWIEREQNTTADLLSRLYTDIPARRRAQIAEWAKPKGLNVVFTNDTDVKSPHIPVWQPDPNYLNQVMLFAKKEKWHCGILHPKWLAQPWYRAVLSPAAVAHFSPPDNSGLQLTIFNFRSVS